MEKQVELEIPAQPEYVRIVRLIIAGIGNALRFNVEELDDLKLAVGEACYQAFQAGAGPHSRLRICTRALDTSVEIEVAVSHARGETTSAYPGLEGIDRGIGLTLMKHLVDEIGFSSNANETKIRFVKKRIAAPREPVELETSI